MLTKQGKMVPRAGLEPASLSAYAPQTYVSTSSTTRASRGSKLSADGNPWQVSSVPLTRAHAHAHARNRNRARSFEYEQEKEHDYEKLHFGR